MSALRSVSTDPAASFADFYRETYRSSVLLALVTTQSVETAEEIVQDAYLQLFRRWNDVGDPRAWLRRAIVSLCTSWVRRTVRARATIVEPLPAVAAAGDLSTEMWAVLAGLPPRQRAAIVLRYVEDMSERDIAHSLKCRQGTVKSMLSRARESLRVSLDESEGDR